MKVRVPVPPAPEPTSKVDASIPAWGAAASADAVKLPARPGPLPMSKPFWKYTEVLPPLLAAFRVAPARSMALALVPSLTCGAPAGSDQLLSSAISPLTQLL